MWLNWPTMSRTPTKGGDAGHEEQGQHDRERSTTPVAGSGYGLAHGLARCPRSPLDSDSARPDGDSMPLYNVVVPAPT